MAPPTPFCISAGSIPYFMVGCGIPEFQHQTGFVEFLCSLEINTGISDNYCVLFYFELGVKIN
jgi:hypothetical protein